jgi:glutathione synthase/RimK-type ligase-like ATP-grasp enzyme
MKQLLILTDEYSEFLVSRADSRHYTSMDINKIKAFFIEANFNVRILKFSELDLSEDYDGVFILYQTSEASGSFYKRYIENLIYFLDRQGAVVLPKYEYLKAHHDKIFMELMRSEFSDDSLKTIKSRYYGSWVDAGNYNSDFPVVIKQSSGSGGEGVFLATNKREYLKNVRKAGHTIVASGLTDLFLNNLKNRAKKIIKSLSPSRSKYFTYNTDPVSSSLVVQNLIPGLSGDYKVLVFGSKYYCMYRKNRDNDFRASGSGMFYDVPEEDHEGLLNFAQKLTSEIDFPILGIDIGFDGAKYHLIEFQMIHLGPSTLQRAAFWHEYHDGKWIRYEGYSDLEKEFSLAIADYINII